MVVEGQSPPLKANKRAQGTYLVKGGRQRSLEFLRCPEQQDERRLLDERQNTDEDERSDEQRADGVGDVPAERLDQQGRHYDADTAQRVSKHMQKYAYSSNNTSTTAHFKMWSNANSASIPFKVPTSGDPDPMAGPSPDLRNISTYRTKHIKRHDKQVKPSAPTPANQDQRLQVDSSLDRFPCSANWKRRPGEQVEFTALTGTI